MEKIEKPDIREQTLQKGLLFPNDEELLMLILGNGIKGCPVRKLSRKVNNVVKQSTSDTIIQNLSQIKGMGISRILAVAAAVEYGRRRNCSHGVQIRHPSDLVPYVQPYALKKKEYFLCVTLNGNHEILQVHEVSVGTVDKSVIYPREVFVPAIQESAAAIVLCHNHPSGSTEPSGADIETTKSLLEASKIIGIPVLDHIIISCSDYFSFMEHDLLFTE